MEMKCGVASNVEKGVEVGAKHTDEEVQRCVPIL